MTVSKIKKINPGIVTFDTNDTNDSIVQPRNLKTIAAEREILRVETIDQHVYYGNLIPHTNKGKTQYSQLGYF